MNRKRTDRWEELIASSPGKRAATVAKYVLAAFSPFALGILIMLLVGGPEQQSRGGTIRVDLLFFTYSAGAALAGGLMGLFLPVTRRGWSATLAGIVALLPWAIGIAVAFDHGYVHWTAAHSFAAAATALVLGTGFGYGFQTATSSRTRSPRAARNHRDPAA